MFNCDAVTRKLVEEGDPGPYFFSTPKLNFIVVFKETIAAGDTRRDRRHHSVGTKLMFPSDTHFTDKGGPSIYLHDTKLVSVLREVIGAEEGDDLAALNRDLTILRTLDRLPSFDPFLTQDALENAGVAPNRHYFAVPEERAPRHSRVHPAQIRPPGAPRARRARGVGHKEHVAGQQAMGSQRRTRAGPARTSVSLPGR